MKYVQLLLSLLDLIPFIAKWIKEYQKKKRESEAYKREEEKNQHSDAAIDSIARSGLPDSTKAERQQKPD